MKRIIYILIFQFAIISTLDAQTGTGIEWQACYGSSLSESLENACKTPDGGYIMVGITPNDTAIGIWTTNFGDADYAVIRIDSVGNVIWAKTYGGDKLDGAYGITKGIRSNRYYIAGKSRSESSTNYHSPSTNGDAWMIAIDDAGTMLWERCYGGYSGDAFGAVVQINDSNVVYGIGITGSDIDEGDVTGVYVDGNEEGWICKINANTGMLIKAKAYGGTGRELLFRAIPRSNTFIAMGWTASKDHDVWNYYGTYSPGGGAIPNGWLLNIDTSLNIVWQKSIGSSGRGKIIEIVNTSDGGFAVLGSTLNQTGDTSMFNFSVGTMPNSTIPKREAFIIKYDSLNNQQWQQHYSAPLDKIEVNKGFAQMTDGGYVFSSNVNKWNGFVMWPYNHGTVIFKTDSAGNLISKGRYGNGSGGYITSSNLFSTYNNKLVFIGYTAAGPGITCSNLSTFNGSGFWHVFQIGHDLGIRQIQKEYSPITVYPNPGNDVFQLKNEDFIKIKSIAIYNSTGQLIKSMVVDKQADNQSFNLSSCPVGLYFIEVNTDNQRYVKKIIKE